MSVHSVIPLLVAPPFFSSLEQAAIMHETQDKAKPPVIELRKFLRSIVQFFTYLKYNTQNKYLPVSEEPNWYIIQKK